jgi:uncharacterized membrane protein YhaH (DUF805 family)
MRLVDRRGDKTLRPEPPTRRPLALGNKQDWGCAMNFGQAIVSGFKRYVDFSGRSSRSEYWWWYLFTLVVAVVLAAVATTGGYGAGVNSPAMLPLRIFQLAVFLPSLAMAVRRLHDTNRSGWWVLIAFTIIGIVVLIVWYCTRGTIGENKFGADPLGAAAPEASPAAS